MSEIPYLQSLGDALEVAIARQAHESQVRLRRRAARMAVVVAATGVLFVLFAAPAIGLRGHITRLFTHAPPAPQRVVKSFAAFDEGVPPSLGTGVLATEARKVLDRPVDADTRAIVWVASRAHGGFCEGVELQVDGRRRGVGAECGPRLERLSFETSLHGAVSPRGEILSGPVLIDGRVGLPKANSVELRFEDGGVVSIPLVWVSPPVDVGFFVYAVPRPHWQPGHVPTTLIVRDAEGNELTRGTVTGIDLRAAFQQQER